MTIKRVLLAFEVYLDMLIALASLHLMLGKLQNSLQICHLFWIGCSVYNLH